MVLMKFYILGRLIAVQEFELLGIKITGVTICELNEQIKLAISNNNKWILANHNLHGVYLYHHNAKLRKFFSSTKIAHIDGMSLIALAKLLGSSLSRKQRVTYVDLLQPLIIEATIQGWRIFFVGSRPEVCKILLDYFKCNYPELDIRIHHGYFDNRIDSIENQKVVNLINSYHPHIVMVGMGMPRQEYWILDNIDRIDANIFLPSGACMDYVVGAIPTPPRWLGNIGLEWLFRLICEPRRLAKRYLIEPWFILWLVIKELFVNLYIKYRTGK